MSESRYEEFRAAHRNRPSPALYAFRLVQQPANEADARVPHHPILISLILAPVVATGSLEIIRLLPFAVGLTGLCFLAAAVVRQTSNPFSALACFGPATFCFPGLPYQFLALPEIFLFTLSAIAFWNLCSGPRETVSGYAPAIACSCVAPLVHLRGLVLFATTAIYLVYLMRRPSNRHSCRIVAFIFLGTLSAVLVANLFLTHWLGAGSGLPIWKERVVLDMFVHYRHGLLPYAPMWILSFAGLVAGLYSCKAWALPALLYLVAFMIGSSSPIGEAYPGRFWVQAIPVLALCLCGFTEGMMRTAVKAIVYLPLAALSLANTLVFLFHPNLHLEARSGAAPYDFLFKMFSGFHFSFWLDVPDSSFVRIAMVCFCALIVAVVAGGSIRRSKSLELAACLLLVTAVEAHRVTPVSINTAAETNAVVVRVAQNEAIAHRPVRLRLEPPWKGIGGRVDESTRPVIEVVDGDTRWRMPIMSGSILVHKRGAPGDDLTVTLRWIDRDPLRVDLAAPRTDVAALACNSVFARFW